MATAEAETSQDQRGPPGGLVYDGFISYSHAADAAVAGWFAAVCQAAVEAAGVADLPGRVVVVGEPAPVVVDHRRVGPIGVVHPSFVAGCG